MPSKSRSTIKRYVLADEHSTVRIPCYAMHGIGRYHCALVTSEVVAVLINADRQVREAPGKVTSSWYIDVEGVPFPSEWRMLGWRYRDGSLPKGPHDAVDPAMAVIEDLPRVNKPFTYGSSC